MNWKSHNPYFNRWFSAIKVDTINLGNLNTVTILILIDGFLQLTTGITMTVPNGMSQSLF